MSRCAKIAVAGAALLLLHGAVLLAGVLAPYDYAEQHREFALVPPTNVHLRHLRPVVYGWVQDASSGDWHEDGSRQYPIRFLTGGRLFAVAPPGVVFLFGSDTYGRDVFSRILYGARISLFTGLLATLVSVALGLALGTVAGFFGGWLDQALMRGGELVMALPWLYLLLAVRAFLPLHIDPLQAFALLIVIIGGVGWVRPARLIRGIVLSARESDFVTAARGFGASDWYLIRRHILPSTLGAGLTQITVLIPQYILAEISLSFLGLGVGEPVPSWGNMLAEGMQYHAIVSHPWLLVPGIATIPVVLGYLTFADVLSGPSKH
jgi:peptide/nickel transport system permease protein